MRLVRFISAGHPTPTCGLITEPGEIQVLKGSLLDRVEVTGERMREADIQRYLPPADPPNILAIGRNYREHARETSDDLPKAPLLFLKATSSLIGHGDPIVLPSVAPTQVDYEAELVVLIREKARHVPLEKALDYVLGYTCGHDVSARDCQRDDGQWARAKSFDTFAPMGPTMVTDLDPTDVRIRMRVNGQTVQDQSTKDMVFSVAALISYLSDGMTLWPGTAIFTGTPCGVGIARKPPLLLKPGDLCEVDVEGVGVLRNPVIAEPSRRNGT